MGALAHILSWPVVAGISTLLLAFAYALGAWRTIRGSRSLSTVAGQIRDLGIHADPSTFTVGDERHVMVVTTSHLLIVDRLRQRVAQRFSHDDVLGLRMSEGGTRVDVALLLDGGAESRTVSSRSIVDFTRLFGLFARQDKHLEFVPEQVS